MFQKMLNNIQKCNVLCNLNGNGKFHVIIPPKYDAIWGEGSTLITFSTSLLKIGLFKLSVLG